MTFEDAMSDGHVQDALRKLEDALMENQWGDLLLGDAEADIKLDYDLAQDDGLEGPFLIVRITSSESVDEINEEEIEDLIAHIQQQLFQESKKWDDDVREALNDSWGSMVLVNGKRVR